MATTGYDDRILLIEVSGLRQQDVMPTSYYTFSVPYRSLARTLQFIRRSGGTIVRIHPLSLSLPIQQPSQTSMPLEANKTEPSPAPEADLEGLPSEGIAKVTESTTPKVDFKGSLPSEGIPEVTESTQPDADSTPPTIGAATGEAASPPIDETETPESSKPPGLVGSLLEKLKSMSWVQHQE
ncbi:MAG: hypothetical protein KME27_07800 [Lyngbya sp. HA4199-MV5]|jgi:hypothetical protein|nr:hypothetical protein [Lyngbya sp. HA4199-MV5]